MNDIELAWAAGFFDGEGTTHLGKSTKGDRFTKPKLTIPQKELECLARFRKALGNRGTIYGPIKQKRDSEIYHYSIQKAKEVDETLTLLWPFLSDVKKNQATKAGFQLGIIRSPRIGRPRGKKIT